MILIIYVLEKKLIALIFGITGAHPDFLDSHKFLAGVQVFAKDILNVPLGQRILLRTLEVLLKSHIFLTIILFLHRDHLNEVPIRILRLRSLLIQKVILFYCGLV